MNRITIDYEATGFFSKIVIDYLNEAASLKPFYKYHADIHSLKQVIEDKQKDKTDRTILVKALEEQYEKIHATEPAIKNIKALLTSNYYNIPRFQRPYSWDRENVSEFWNDAIADSDGDYFIGSMVVFKSNGDLYGGVDGQQRLTTIMMILCALRNALARKRPKINDLFSLTFFHAIIAETAAST